MSYKKIIINSWVIFLEKTKNNLKLTISNLDSSLISESGNELATDEFEWAGRFTSQAIEALYEKQGDPDPAICVTPFQAESFAQWVIGYHIDDDNHLYIEVKDMNKHEVIQVEKEDPEPSTNWIINLTINK